MSEKWRQIRVRETTYHELVKLKGLAMSSTGKELSFDDLLQSMVGYQQRKVDGSVICRFPLDKGIRVKAKA